MPVYLSDFWPLPLWQEWPRSQPLPVRRAGGPVCPVPPAQSGAARGDNFHTDWDNRFACSFVLKRMDNAPAKAGVPSPPNT